MCVYVYLCVYVCVYVCVHICALTQDTEDGARFIVALGSELSAQKHTSLCSKRERGSQPCLLRLVICAKALLASGRGEKQKQS